MFDEHYLCISTDAETPKPAAKLPAADEAVAELSGKVKQPSAPVTEDVDIDELLKDL